MESCKNLQNLYEVRKSVRFELKPYKKTREILKTQDLDLKIKHIKVGEFEKDFNWNQFCKGEYQDYLENSGKFYKFLDDVNHEIEKDKKIDLSKKEIFFDFKRSKGIFKNIPSLKKIEKFDETFKNKLLEIEEEYKNVFNYFSGLNEKEKQNQKKSETSKNLRKIAYLNRNIFTIFKFLDKYKTDEEIFENYQNIFNEDFEKTNNSIIASHENEISGVCIGKYTFNKYSLFRRETDNLKTKFESNKNQNEKSVKYLIKNKEIKDDKGFLIDLKFETIINLKLEKEDKVLQDKLENFYFDRNLDEVISELDNINGSLLNNYIQDFIKDFKINKQTLSFEYGTENGRIKYNKGKVNLNGKHNNISALRGQKLDGGKYLYLLKKDIETLSKEEKENLKLVHKFLNIIFKNYQINIDFNTIKLFRDHLSKYRGKIRQDLRVSEREFINEAMIESYAKVLEKDGSYFLALTKKNKILDNKIENIEIEKNIKSNIFGNTFKIYNYSHLHFGALEKLCLVGDGDLIKNDVLVKQWNKYKNQKDSSENIDFKTFQNHIIKSLEKLKENNGEDWLKHISDIQKLRTIEEIVNFINQRFYKLDQKEILTEKVFELAENGDIELYQIYSKDFNIFNENFLSGEREKQRILKSGDGYVKGIVEVSEENKLIGKTTREKGKKENLFTLYFKEIFKNTDTFLGQEGGIFFRKGDKEKIERRFLDDKFFVSFDIKFYKGQQNHNAKLCEKKDKILEEHINQINNFTKEKIKNLKSEDKIFIGLDRGENEHITYGIYDGNLKFLGTLGNTNYVKKVSKKDNQENFEILGNGNNLTLSNDLENSEKIYKQLKTTIKYFDENGREENKLLEFNGLKDFHITKLFKKLENGEYFADLENGGRFVLNKNKYGFTILDKIGNEIKIIDRKDKKEVLDYYLIFQSEKFKRVLQINDQIKYSQNMWNLKKGYISIIKDFLKQKVLKYKRENKEVIFIFENQTSNKGTISNKDLGATILSDIEEQIINEYNLLFFKEDKEKLQTTPNIRKTDILAKNNNFYDTFGNCIFINQDNTSTGCPNCKESFIEIEEKKGKKIIKEIPGNILYGHGTGTDENSMKHLTNDEYNNLYNSNEKFKKEHSNDKGNKKENKYLPGIINGKPCTFYLQNPNYPEFSFITSGDDLATYNIAKKGLEYLSTLQTNAKV